MTYSITAPGRRSRVLSRRLTMIVAAGAIALAGLTAGTRPARADAEDLLRFLAGAIIIGAIVHSIDDNHTPRYLGQWELPNSCLETVRVNWRDIQVYNAQCLRRAGYHGLPNYCRRDINVGWDTRRSYVAECLWEAGYYPEGRRWGHQPPYTHQPPRTQPPLYDYQPPRVSPPSPPPHTSNFNILPASCQMHYRQEGRRIEGYWGGCLADAGFRNLPRHCRVTTRDGDHLYTARCLYDAGYRRPH